MMQRRTLLGSIGALVAWLGGRAAAQSVGAGQAWVARPSDTEDGRARLLAALPYTHVTVSGATAMTEWEKLRAEGRGWPVIVGDDEGLLAIAEQFSIDDPAIVPVAPGTRPSPPPRSPAEILAAAASVKLPGDLTNRFGDLGKVEMPPSGDWPANLPPGSDEGPGLTVAMDYRANKPLDTVHILILPTHDSAEVPAYLRWGNWNACPSPELHVAMLRDWKRRFGTELIGIDREVMNLRTGRMPATRPEALALAREQYDYCPDIVDQGIGTIEALAAALMRETWWFFWWD